MLNEADRLILDGERGVVSVATAKWGFDARNETELSFDVGAEIRVLDQHESGWWTGTYNGKTGFFPANRTESREVNLKAYNESQKRQHTVRHLSQSAGAAPPLPDPMVKAGKLLGISEKEAQALSPTSKSRQDRSVSVGGDLVSPRKALDVMGFEDEGMKHRSSFSGFSRMTQKIRRFGTPERKNSTSSPRANRSGMSSPRGSPQVAKAEPPSPRLKFAEQTQAKDEPRPSPSVQPATLVREEAPIELVSPTKKTTFDDDDDWGDEGDADDSNLIY